MKTYIKRLAVLLLCLMCAVSFAAAAYADNTTYTSFGTVSAGTYINERIFSSSDGTVEYVAEAIPSGCQIVAEQQSDYSIAYFLRGTPGLPGDYEFTLTLTEPSGAITYYVCNISVEPSDITVTAAQSEVQQRVGSTATIQVYASVSDNGYLTYQWYSAGMGTQYMLEGETSSVLNVPCNAIGSYYYFCRVTNTSNGVSRYRDSGYIVVDVIDRMVSSVSIQTLPQQTTFSTGDVNNYTGLVLLVEYNTGESEYITSGFSVEPNVFQNAGITTVTVSYYGVTCTYDVTVNAVQETVSAIGITSLPQKTSYVVGETLNTSGLTVRVYSNVKTYDITSGFTCTPVNFTTAGTQTITVGYEGQTCTFTVSVALPAAEAISVSVLPSVTAYTVGDTLNTSGLVISVISGTYKRDVVTGFTCSPTTLTHEGSQEITVSYEGQTCTFYVRVSAAAADSAVITPSPSQSSQQTEGEIYVTPTPAAAYPSSGAAANISDSESSSRKTATKVLTVILIVAIASLVALCAYVFIMQHDRILDALDNLFTRPSARRSRSDHDRDDNSDNFDL